MGVRGFGLVLTACMLILRFSKKYYLKNKSKYSIEQQNMLEVLFGAAEWISAHLKNIVSL